MEPFSFFVVSISWLRAVDRVLAAPHMAAALKKSRRLIEVTFALFLFRGLRWQAIVRRCRAGSTGGVSLFGQLEPSTATRIRGFRVQDNSKFTSPRCRLARSGFIGSAFDPCTSHFSKFG